jgi:hypothetical protein
MADVPVYTADLQAISDSLTANEKAARDVVGGLTGEQLQWRPEAGWSILQCLEHVTLANRAYSAAIKGSVSRGSGLREFKPGKSSIRPGPLARLFLKKLEPPVTQKVRAPRSIVPGSGRTSDEVLTAFEQSHREIRELIGAAHRLDLNAIKFRNPLLPLIRVRVGTGLLIMPAHERRHLWQAHQVRMAILKSN